MQLSICAWTLLTSLHAIISERNNQANVAAPVDVLTTCDRLVPAAKHDLYTGMQAVPWKISAPDTTQTHAQRYSAGVISRGNAWEHRFHC